MNVEESPLGAAAGVLVQPVQHVHLQHDPLTSVGPGHCGQRHRPEAGFECVEVNLVDRVGEGTADTVVSGL